MYISNETKLVAFFCFWGNKPIIKLRVVEFFTNAKRHHIMIFVFPTTLNICLIKFVNRLSPDRAKISGIIWIHTVGHSTRFPERYFSKTIICKENSAEDNTNIKSGADPGFIEMGGHMYKGVGVRFADFISFFSNIP